MATQEQAAHARLYGDRGLPLDVSFELVTRRLPDRGRFCVPHRLERKALGHEFDLVELLTQACSPETRRKALAVRIVFTLNRVHFDVHKMFHGYKSVDPTRVAALFPELRYLAIITPRGMCFEFDPSHDRTRFGGHLLVALAHTVQTGVIILVENELCDGGLSLTGPTAPVFNSERVLESFTGAVIPKHVVQPWLAIPNQQGRVRYIRPFCLNPFPVLTAPPAGFAPEEIRETRRDHSGYGVAMCAGFGQSEKRIAQIEPGNDIDIDNKVEVILDLWSFNGTLSRITTLDINCGCSAVSLKTLLKSLPNLEILNIEVGDVVTKITDNTGEVVEGEQKNKLIEIEDARLNSLRKFRLRYGVIESVDLQHLLEFLKRHRTTLSVVDIESPHTLAKAHTIFSVIAHALPFLSALVVRTDRRGNSSGGLNSWSFGEDEYRERRVSLFRLCILKMRRDFHKAVSPMSPALANMPLSLIESEIIPLMLGPEHKCDGSDLQLREFGVKRGNRLREDVESAFRWTERFFGPVEGRKRKHE